MSTYTSTATIPHDISNTFTFLRDPRNLPYYFPRVTKAELVAPELVRTTAVVDDDGDGDDEPVTSDAWFKADEEKHTISWGSPTSSGYEGSLSFQAQTGQTQIRLQIDTVNDYPGVQESLDEALTAIAARLDALADGSATTEP